MQWTAGAAALNFAGDVNTTQNFCVVMNEADEADDGR